MVLHRLLLAQHRLDAGQVAAQRLELVGGLELPHRLLDPQPEQLVVEILLALLQLVRPQIAEFPDLHTAFSSANRVANFVRMGTFAAARRIASRASCSVTPSISNRIRPGRTTHTHCSGAPFPLPIRVSAGFLVIGLSGNRRIHTLPPRLIDRVMATRAASICRSVIHAHSIAFSPNSPKLISLPRQALPAMRPRCCFLYLTFFGIIMAVYAPYLFSSGVWSAGFGVSVLAGSAAGDSWRTSCFQLGCCCGDINGGRIGAVGRAAGRGRSAGAS